MTLSIIVAVAKDGAIGQDNALLWHLPDDLKRFKALTTGHSILMGRKTWQSLPNGSLPNRRNLVLSKSIKELPEAEVFGTIEEMLGAVEGEEEVFVIGGEMLYRALLPLCTRLYITEVEACYPEADAHFPELKAEEWTCVHEEQIPQDERNALPSIYRILQRK